MICNHTIRFSRLLVALSLVLVGIGCRTAKTPMPTRPATPPLAPARVKIGSFLCENQITAHAVNNVFGEVFSRNRRLKLVRDEEAEILIEGTITYSQGGSSGSSFGAGSSWAAGKSQAVAGEYVSGITAVAYHKGEVVVSASWGQVMKKGAEMLPPEYVAREAATSLLSKLDRKYLSAKYAEIVWCGLDYSKVKMIGATEFDQSDQIFPGMLMAWNDLFVNNMLPEIAKMARSVETDLKPVQANNQKTTKPQIERTDGTTKEMLLLSHIQDSDIAELVRSYELDHKTGTGLVFVVDRLVKAQATSCFYVVFFDVASRNVIYSARYCEKASGNNFLDYWFRPFKVAVEKLRE
jgi:hypothetical protein